MKPYIVAITGASGILYGVRLLQVLAEQKVPVELVISDTARIVIKEELGIDIFGSKSGREICELLGIGATDGSSSNALIGDPNAGFPLEARGNDKSGVCGNDSMETIHFHSFKDFTAPIASGSYPAEGMVVVPCSMGTLGAIASGLSQNLIHRAADCTIKEGRKLVLVPRETPLSAIHLENMLKLARLGVRIVPAMPAFYSGQKEVHELVDFVVGKIMDQLGIPHALYPRWVGSLSKDVPGHA